MPAKFDQTYEAIRSQLVSGDLAVGEKVSEQGLASQLGVSRSPVREAIKRLQKEGFFEQVHRIGTIVREPNINELIEAYELRAALEPHAMRITPAEQYTPNLPELRRLCGALREVAEASVELAEGKGRDELVQEFFRLDERFHELLLTCSGNDRFARLVGDARLFTQIHTVKRHSVITFETVMGVFRYHSKILDAIETGDMPEAARVMTEHIHLSRDGAMDWLRFQMNRQPKH